MKDLGRVLVLVVFLGLLCSGNLFALDYIWPRDFVLEFSKKNAEENKEYFKSTAQAAGISSISNVEEVAKYIVNTNPPMDKAKYFVFLSCPPREIYDNYFLMSNALKGEFYKFSKDLLYSSTFTYIIEQREKYNNLKDVYFFMEEDIAFKKLKGDAFLKWNLAPKDEEKMQNKLCQKYNKICFKVKHLGFISRTDDLQMNKIFLEVYQKKEVLLTEEEFNSLGYMIFITQNYNPYNKEFAVEKRFALPNQKEQLGFKNTFKLVEEAFQWMDTQATNIQRMATQGGSQ